MLALHHQRVTRLDGVHAFERGGAGHDGLHQLMEKTLGAETPRNLGMGEHRLELGTEDQRAVDLRPVQRLDAEAIAHEHQSIALAVIQGEGELAPQVAHHVLHAQARIKVQHQLRVALGAKARAARGQVGAQALVVVKLAVVRQHEPAVAGHEWLPAAVFVQVDDGQPRVAEADAAVVHGAPSEAVRPAMVLDRRHGDQGARVHRPCRVSVYIACDSTHIGMIPQRRDTR